MLMAAKPPFELIQFPDAETLAELVAERWFHGLLKHGPGRPYCVALSGGRIAMDFHAALAEGATAHRALLDGVHFFWGDERCVPPTSPESNFKAAQQLFLQPAQIPENQIHRVRGEIEPGLAAREAAQELRRIATMERDQPVFDLILLGMGEDGHVASLFPGESESVMQSPDVFRPVTAVKAPAQRITLGYGTIAAAREVWVLASGKAKEGALKSSITPAGNTPLARVLRQRQSTRIFTDLVLS